jgi:hypothetical protein
MLAQELDAVKSFLLCERCETEPNDVIAPTSSRVAHFSRPHATDPATAGLRALQRPVVDLEEVGYLGKPAVSDKAEVLRVLVVRGVRSLIGEFHRNAKSERVLRAYLADNLEGLDAGDRSKARRSGEKGSLLSGARRVTQRERNGVPDAGRFERGHRPEDTRRAAGWSGRV